MNWKKLHEILKEIPEISLQRIVLHYQPIQISPYIMKPKWRKFLHIAAIFWCTETFGKWECSMEED